MTAKVFRVGTHRVRLPERTWELIEPLLPDYDITRIADVTGLDIIGVPVVMSVRPRARTLSVSQGKGQTLLLAKLSAAMEALEIWHAEHCHPPLVHRQAPAGDLGLPYRIEQLCVEPGALINDHTPLDWINAVGLGDGAAVPVPVRLVTAAAGPQAWLPPGFRWSTNGLASGNSYQEACLHALYEVIERDAVSRQVSGAPVEYVESESVDDPSCAEVIGRIAGAGVTLRITRVPSRFDVPCFGATIWSPDLPLTGIGWGAHLDAGVAVSRAVTEAVQGRLSTIAGSRDDIPALYHKVTINTEEPPPADGSVIAWDEAINVGPGSFDDLADELTWVCAKVAEVSGLQPLAVDLSTVVEFAVVKVFVVDAAFDKDRA